MGKKWDNTGIAYNVDMWKECLRVLKAGGHLVSFGGTRTYHRMAVAIEDAGFEIRDMIEWVYASGFPKSMNIGKMYDKKIKNKREIIGKGKPMSSLGVMHDDNWKSKNEYNETKGTSPYEGLGTALKPAHEPIVLARKPLSEKTVVDNIIKWGTGGIEIDKCRIPTTSDTRRNAKGGSNGLNGTQTFKIRERRVEEQKLQTGRFPANIICQDDALNDGEN
jgi:site-specific DNA-methyltransferase (adenine-specific)